MNVKDEPVESPEALAAKVRECVFVPPGEPWTCRVHQGVRTSLDETQCDIARPAEPFNDAYLDNIRQGIAEGRNPGSRYNVRRLLATLDRERIRADRLAYIVNLADLYLRRYGLANTSGERHEDRKERVRDLRDEITALSPLLRDKAVSR